MNSSVLGAGWPFAWLRLWQASDGEAAPENGVVTENEGRSRLVVDKTDGSTDEIELDSATAIYGVDGYPLTLGDLRVGDVVEILQEKRGLAFVTTGIHIVRPAWVK